MERIASLDLLDPEFRQRLDRLLAATATGLPTLKIFESIRSPDRQSELYSRGRDPNAADFGRTVTRAQPYQSAHQFGRAVDLVFCPGGKWSWNEPNRGDWDRLASAAAEHGLETLSFEKPHVQIAGFDWRKLSTGPMDTADWMEWLR